MGKKGREEGRRAGKRKEREGMEEEGKGKGRQGGKRKRKKIGERKSS